MNSGMFRRCVLVSILVVGCSDRDELMTRSNPFDAGGDSFATNQAPRFTEVNAGKNGWYDFDFVDSTGSLLLRFNAVDNNERYDTLEYVVRVGSSPAGLDTVYVGTRGFHVVDSVAAGQTIHFAVTVYDSHGDSVDTIGSVTAPAGFPPPAPSSFSLVETENLLGVEWGRSSGATGYRVYRSDTLDGDYREICDTPAAAANPSAYRYSDAPADYQAHYYRVAAYNSYGQSLNGATRPGRRYYTKIPTPMIESASRGTYSGYIQVVWSSVSDYYYEYNIASYVVYRADSSQGIYERIGSVQSGSSDYSYSLRYDDSVETSRNYYYRVAAFDRDGRGGRLSDYAVGYLARLSAPSSVYASDSEYSSHIRITWYSVYSAVGYRIYRSTNSSSGYVLIGSTTSTAYNDSVSTGEVYYYKIAAYDSKGGEGTLSSYNSGQRKALPAPGALGVSNGSHVAHISASWSSVPGAQAYVIYRSQSSGLGFAPLDTVTATTYRDSAVVADSSYYYRVAAIDASGAGTKTDAVIGRVMYAPTGVNVAPSESYLRISWTSASYADGYVVHRADSANGPYVRIDTVAKTLVEFRDSVGDYSLHYYRVTGYNANGESPLGVVVSGALYPAKPTGLVAVDRPNSVLLSWRSAGGAEGYHVYRAPTVGGAAVRIGTTTDTFYVDTALSSGRYSYRVRSYNSFIEGTLSTPVSGGPIGPPCAPANYTVYRGSDNIRLTWTDNAVCSRAERFYVYRDTISTATPARIDSTDTTFFVDSLTSARTYYYWVAGVNSQGEGSRTSPLSTSLAAPLAPSGLTVGDATYATHLPLTWRRSAGADTYYIYRSVGGSTAFSAYDTTADTTYNDSAVTLGVSYYYRLMSMGLAGTSASYSSTASGRLLDAPTGPSAVGYTSHIAVRWTPSRLATRYIVYRATVLTGPFTAVDTVETVTYGDTVTDAADYYYRIAALSLGESALSPVAGPARRKLPLAPTGVSATDGTLADTVRVTWTASAGADGYRVYRSRDTALASLVLRGSTSTASFADTVSDDTLYFYRVKAYNGAGESVLSAGLDSGFARPASAPGTPTSLAASDTIAAYIELQWSAPVGGSPLNGYILYRSGAESGQYSVRDTVAATTYQDVAPLTFPTTYWYKVSAYNAAGEGVATAAVEGTRNQ